LEQRGTVKLSLSAICGILTPIVAFTSISLAINSAPAFSWTENALSDLGVMPGVTSALFNYGVITSGILGFIFATSLFKILRFTGWRGPSGALLFSSACIALVSIGVFSENVAPVHFFVSVVFFVLLIAALLQIGIAYWFLKQKPIAAFTLTLSIIALVPWLMLFFVRYVSGVAFPELIAGVAGALWTPVVSYKLLKKATHTKCSNSKSQNS